MLTLEELIEKSLQSFIVMTEIHNGIPLLTLNTPFVGNLLARIYLKENGDFLRLAEYRKYQS